ncbi:MAG: PEP-CTERM sorting domain-containing protein [Phycisphaerales bacterium]
MKTVVSLMAVAGLAAAASAQTYQSGAASIVFEVWNGSSWTNSVDVAPGATVEWRTRVQYTGTSTLNGLAEVWYQPTFGNADNSGAGASADQVSVGQGLASGNNSSPTNLVSPSDANSGAALSAYGRVFPFALAATNASSSNITTVFRHSGGASGAPAGEWIRVAGSGATAWADANSAASALIRGIQSNQTSQGSAPTQHNEGLNVVIFRGAFTASDDTALRTVVLSTDGNFLRRVSTTDATRYIAWQTSSSDTGTGATGLRTTNNAIIGANINIVPTPASIALMGLGGLVAARRRRA